MPKDGSRRATVEQTLHFLIIWQQLTLEVVDIQFHRGSPQAFQKYPAQTESLACIDHGHGKFGLDGTIRTADQAGKSYESTITLKIGGYPFERAQGQVIDAITFHKGVST